MRKGTRWSTSSTYATEPDRVAADGEGRNGPFTAALLKNIRKPGLEIEQMMKLALDAVFRSVDADGAWQRVGNC